MSEIKRCPTCNETAYIWEAKSGYMWGHWCGSKENRIYSKTSFGKFGEAVKDWNSHVKNKKNKRGNEDGKSD